MKKRIKDLMIGFLIGCILMTTTPVLADSIIQKIDVALNTVNVEINGQKLDTNTILYNGTTYLPMRKVAESVGKDVEWNQTTMTANIVEKSLVGENMIDEFTIYQQDGNFFANKNGEIYYSVGYVVRLMNDFKFYGMDINKYNTEKIIRFYNEDQSTLIDNVPYDFVQDRVFISKTYYETTILPLIKK